MSVDEVFARIAAMQAEQDKLLDTSLHALTHAELLEVLERWERLRRQTPALDHAALARLAAEAEPAELGAKTLGHALAARLRIDLPDARRRLADAADLGPRTSFTGEPLPPVLAATAAGQRRGDLGAAHVKVIRDFLRDLPGWIDATTREQAQETLADVGTRLCPAQLKRAAGTLALLLNEDGTFTDTDRARRRGISIGRQQTDGMSEIRGWLDPQARAVLDAVLAKLAAPGMCNPDQPDPCVDGDPTPDQLDRDTRTQAQRNHDALTAMGRAVLAAGTLGDHHGLPVTVVVTTTLQDLESGVGLARTATGTHLPMADVIRMAARAHHYLAVFDEHLQVPLYLGRAKRFATPGQRLVLYAHDGGCTFPGCTTPAAWCQVHHANGDWADGGRTDITDLTLACGGDHGLANPTGYTTRKSNGRTEWIPPPELDHGQPRTNDYHHPRRYLVRENREDDEEPG
ncbi:HNH endonuclease signature motif containing protein [Mycobacterium sp. MYCO198283]|uniref:HNH endonuclease signature motif containing protein n=1 Tax=Mycobacterium sp. MYCO198283 TaxID=2883505 RepID=UPI00272DE8BB|nr:HNH endonuclease signature motif containing protein [Mycobacterium sp. MYCO198283]